MRSDLGLDDARQRNKIAAFGRKRLRGEEGREGSGLEPPSNFLERSLHTPIFDYKYQC